MNSVIKNILSRKGLSGPFNDGRNIHLVLFGGVMRGIRGAGAVIALEELGLSNAFDKIHTVSAGFPNAAYLITNNTKVGTSIYYENLTNKKFINFLRLWNIINIDYMIDAMKNYKKLSLDKIYNSHTKLCVLLFNIKNKKTEYVEINSIKKENFFDVMKAATSIPYLSKPTKLMNCDTYCDIPKKYNCFENHIQHAINDGATDILVIYNGINQKNNNVNFPEYVYEIIPPKFSYLSRFELKAEKLKAAAIQMGKIVKETFGFDSEINLK